jgi:hypothetical protein
MTIPALSTQQIQENFENILEKFVREDDESTKAFATARRLLFIISILKCNLVRTELCINKGVDVMWFSNDKCKELLEPLGYDLGQDEMATVEAIPVPSEHEG